MTNRKPKNQTAPETAAAAPSPETAEVATTYLRGLDDYITVKSPRNVREQLILDGLRRELEKRHQEIEEFITEKMAEGFSLAEINQLYSVEVPLMPWLEDNGRRVRVKYPSNILER